LSRGGFHRKRRKSSLELACLKGVKWGSRDQTQNRRGCLKEKKNSERTLARQPKIKKKPGEAKNNAQTKQGINSKKRVEAIART